MIVTIEKISRLNFQRVSYYTARVEGRPKSEYDDFLTRMAAVPRYREDLRILSTYIVNMGNAHGARDHFFRKQNPANALPPKKVKLSAIGQEQGLRRYCIRLSDTIVVLLNGDMKTMQKAQDCPNCGPHFEFANKLAIAIDKGIRNNDIELDHDEKEILIEEDFSIKL